MSLTDQVVAQLDQSMRQWIPAIHTLVRMQRANLKQWYSGKELQERWSMGDKAVIVLLEREIGYVGVRGMPVRVHLDDVLRVDEVLRIGRAAAAEQARSEVA
jgi:hypothetical protein